MRIKVDVEVSDGSQATVLDVNFAKEPNWYALAEILKALWLTEEYIRALLETQASEETEGGE
jgi:hypothetical protein